MFNGMLHVPVVRCNAQTDNRPKLENPAAKWGGACVSNEDSYAAADFLKIKHT